VTYEVRPYPTYPAAFPGGARITTVEGRVYEADLPHQRGSSGNPMRDEDIREKFRANAALAISEAEAKRLESDVVALDVAAVAAGLGRAATMLSAR